MALLAHRACIGFCWAVAIAGKRRCARAFVSFASAGRNRQLALDSRRAERAHPLRIPFKSVPFREVRSPCGRANRKLNPFRFCLCKKTFLTPLLLVSGIETPWSSRAFKRGVDPRKSAAAISSGFIGSSIDHKRSDGKQGDSWSIAARGDRPNLNASRACSAILFCSPP